MRKMKVEIDNIEELPEVARNLLSTFGEERFFAFFGKMGVGKTTLIKELCLCLGVEDNVCSPTFAIVNEYSRPLITHHSSLITKSEPVYHFDFYRLKNLAEAYDIGYEEYFYSGYYCFTEWTEKIEELLPERYVRVEIEEKEGVRILTAEARES
jgi:tRNA threonylcarbamoyladenosine biosynthesis protein TsaE